MNMFLELGKTTVQLLVVRDGIVQRFEFVLEEIGVACVDFIKHQVQFPEICHPLRVDGERCCLQGFEEFAGVV